MEDDGYILVPDEETMILLFLELIEDADIVTGWNSRFYDIPYLINRIRYLLGGESLEDISKEDGEEFPFNPSEESFPYLMKFCLFPELPKMQMVERYGNNEVTFDLCGRPHLDYLELYRKFNLKKKHSYKLDYILQDEIKQSKVQYDGPLELLQRNEFRKFIAYSRQDVAGLSALDDKLKMIEMASMMAHRAAVTMDKVLGSVVIIEQSILRILHKKGIIAFDREKREKDPSVPGAFVAEPDGGLYEWVCSFDISSLYPSLIRALNISPEVLIGQFDLTRTEIKLREAMIRHNGDSAAAWGEFTGVLEYHDIIEERPINLTLVLEADGEELSASGEDWKRILKENNWCVTANGTVFDMSRLGIIAECLNIWYAERDQFRKEAKKYEKLADEAKEINEIDKEKEYRLLAVLYELRQQVAKLTLNSLYGCYLQFTFRFYDPRCGRSVTLSGRCVVKHMNRTGDRIIAERDFM